MSCRLVLLWQVPRWLLKSSAFPRSFLCLLCKTVKCMATLPRLPVPADCECLSVVASCRGESVAGLSCGVALPGSNQSPVWTSHRTWVASVFSPCVLECDGASCFIQYVFTPVCLSTRNLSIYLSITRLTLQVPGDTICFANEPSLGSDQSSAAPAGNKCYGACMEQPPCLVMAYAAGGALDNAVREGPNPGLSPNPDPSPSPGL